MAQIGEARYDENGRTSYGEPGDQTTKEVCISNFYLNPSKPWQLVLRPKTKALAENLAYNMTEACNNDAIGYAQYGDGSTKYRDRYGLYFALQTGKTMQGVTIPCNCDCSSLVAQCLILSGVNVTIYMSTSDEVNVIMQTGKFDQITFQQGMILYDGDIMWRQGHTGIIVKGDEKIYDKTPKWVARVITPCNVKVSPSIYSRNLPEWPNLGIDNLIDVCDQDGDFWYVRIAGQYFGFVLKDCVVNNDDPQPPFVEFDGRVTTDLYMRKGPGSQYGYYSVDFQDGKGKRNVLKQGEIVHVIDQTNGWDEIKVPGLDKSNSPWSSGKYIEKIEPEPQKIGMATTELNVRVGPGTQYGYCTFDRNDGKGARHTLKQGETAPIIGEENGWYQIELVGATTTWTPWCSAKYMKIVK